MNRETDRSPCSAFDITLIIDFIATVILSEKLKPKAVAKSTNSAPNIMVVLVICLELADITE